MDSKIKIKARHESILPLSIKIVQSYFYFAKLDLNPKQIKSFTKWLNISILYFIKEQEDLGNIEDAQGKIDSYKNIIKHSSELVKLVSKHYKLLELQHDVLSTEEKNIQNSPFVREANKLTSNGVPLAICYALNSKIDTDTLLAELIAIIAKTKIEIEKTKSSQKRGRKQELKALNDFAANFAKEYYKVIRQPITVFREKGPNGEYLAITPAHILFSNIINEINPILTKKITDKNIINALEHAQKKLKNNKSLHR